MAIFAQRLEKVKLAGSAALGGVGHPGFTVSAAPCPECLGSPMGLLVNAPTGPGAPRSHAASRSNHRIDARLFPVSGSAA